MDWSGVDYCDVFIRLSFWRHPFTAEHPLTLILTAPIHCRASIDSHSDGTHSLQSIHWLSFWWHLFTAEHPLTLILTAPIHCRASIGSHSDGTHSLQSIHWLSFWRHPFTAEHPLALILMAPIHCRASIAETLMQCYISPNLMKKQTLSFIGQVWLHTRGISYSDRSSTVQQNEEQYTNRQCTKLQKHNIQYRQLCVRSDVQILNEKISVWWINNV